MAELPVIEAVCAVAHGLPISVALGELGDWSHRQPIPQLPANVTYAKLGLFQPPANWVAAWTNLRSRFDTAAGRPLAWVAVVYADGPGPPPTDIIAAATATGCAAVLVDTFHKQGRGVFDVVSPDELTAWRTAAAELPFALAGSLRLPDLPRVAQVRPKIVAIRGAACGAGDRQGTISKTAVREFRQALPRAW